jgi:hypothetical protein
MGYCCETKSGREPEFQTAGEVGVFPNRPESINPIESSEPNVLRKDWPNRNRQALNFDHRSSILVNTKGRVRLKQRRNWSGEFRVKQRAIKIDRPPGAKGILLSIPGPAAAHTRQLRRRWGKGERICGRDLPPPRSPNRPAAASSLS